MPKIVKQLALVVVVALVARPALAGDTPPLASLPTRKADGSRLRGNEKTVARKQALSARALTDLDRWIADHLRVAAAA